MPGPTHFSQIPPAGQAPRAASCKGTPDLRRYAHSASPKVLSEAEGLRNPVKSSQAGWTTGRSVLRQEPPLQEKVIG